MTNTPDKSEMVDEAFAMLCRKYVQRADERQRGMGLQYTEAETHDLAKTIATFAALQAVPAASEVGEDDEEEPLYFCEQCHAPLYADDEYAVDEYSVAGCWHAMTDDPSIAGRPCYAARFGKPSAALKASGETE